MADNRGAGARFERPDVVVDVPGQRRPLLAAVDLEGRARIVVPRIEAPSAGCVVADRLDRIGEERTVARWTPYPSAPGRGRTGTTSRTADASPPSSSLSTRRRPEPDQLAHGPVASGRAREAATVIGSVDARIRRRVSAPSQRFTRRRRRRDDLVRAPVGGARISSVPRLSTTGRKTIGHWKGRSPPPPTRRRVCPRARRQTVARSPITSLATVCCLATFQTRFAAHHRSWCDSMRRLRGATRHQADIYPFCDLRAITWTAGLAWRPGAHHVDCAIHHALCHCP
jgi:hypothetical protein